MQGRIQELITKGRWGVLKSMNIFMKGEGECTNGGVHVPPLPPESATAMGNFVEVNQTKVDYYKI